MSKKSRDPVTGLEEDDTRVRDMVNQLSHRRRLCDRLITRIGARGWCRPRVAVSSRIFKLYRLADPWDPQSRDDDRSSIALGPVSLRLGEQRREVAPHAKPKEPKKKASKKRNHPRVDGARRGTDKDTNRFPPGFTPPTGVPKAAPAQPAPKSMFGNSSATRPLVGNLPMRPELAEKIAAEKSEGTDKQSSSSSPVRRSKPIRRMRRRPATSEQSDLPNSDSESSGNPASTRRPVGKSNGSSGRRGRLTMRSTVARSPIITEVQPVEPTVVENVEKPDEVEATPPPRFKPQTNTLDDLFGFGGQEGRMRMKPVEEDNSQDD